MALFFAGTRPERTAALIVADATARYLVADDYPIGFPPEATEAMVARAAELWGTEAIAGINAPSRAGDERFLRWSARLQRAIASPRVVRAYLQALLEVDVRPVLPLIQAPTLVLQGDRDEVTLQHGAAVAAALPQGRLAVLPGTHELPTENPGVVNALLLWFLAGAAPGTAAGSSERRGRRRAKLGQGDHPRTTQGRRARGP
jgi:pimeloyl-ACP methyl ester carboxylesterase